jgi:putative endonuclease
MAAEGRTSECNLRKPRQPPFKTGNESTRTVKAWVYILKCADGSYYTGSTNNLPLRLAQHEAGEGGGYTQTRLPVELVFSQEFPSEHEAFLREWQVKGWSRAKKEALIRGDFGALVELSKSRSSGDQDLSDT